MKKTFSSKKSAFSLIELSIVLIIIGLLIAGVTGGASLIKSSQLRSVMGEARGYAVAVNAFYSQFNGVPGDFPTPIGSSMAGNNNNNIEYFSSGGGSSTTTAESANAWVALRTIGAVDSISLGAPSAATVAPLFGTTSTSTAPASKIQSAGWVFDYRNYIEGAVAAAAAQNVVILTAPITTTATAMSITPAGLGTNNSVAAITGADALSIDSKIDDGQANAGKVRGINPATAATTTGSCYTYSGTANSTYLTTSTAKTCALSYQVDVNS